MKENAPSTCPLCGGLINHIRAGVSKRTGKPYNEFWACSDRSCEYTWHPTTKPKEETVEIKETPTFNRIGDIATKDDIEKVLNALREIYKVVTQNTNTILPKSGSTDVEEQDFFR